MINQRKDVRITLGVSTPNMAGREEEKISLILSNIDKSTRHNQTFQVPRVFKS